MWRSTEKERPSMSATTAPQTSSLRSSERVWPACKTSSSTKTNWFTTRSDNPSRSTPAKSKEPMWATTRGCPLLVRPAARPRQKWRFDSCARSDRGWLLQGRPSLLSASPHSRMMPAKPTSSRQAAVARSMSAAAETFFRNVMKRANIRGWVRPVAGSRSCTCRASSTTPLAYSRGTPMASTSVAVAACAAANRAPSLRAAARGTLAGRWPLAQGTLAAAGGSPRPHPVQQPPLDSPCLRSSLPCNSRSERSRTPSCGPSRHTHANTAQATGPAANRADV
mmetsp:Transcript_113805/g.332446  ORF Transcript_113805/g.332446 Transcript_113805/m.332446 type:complete len:280 (-) Transcript_113805:85-924(-)